MLNILIVEDEENLGITLSEYLKGLGHGCFWAKDAKSARELFTSQKPGVILMDIGLMG